MAARQLVVFKLENQDFGIDIHRVERIIKPVNFYRVPDVPDYIVGLINLRGIIYTVFDLKKKFKIGQAKITDDSRIIIVKTENNHLVGFLVDQVNETLRIEDNDFEDAPEVIKELDRRYVEGVAKPDERIVMVLNLSLALSLKDIEQLDSFEKLDVKEA